VATALGVMLAVSVWLGLAIFVTWLVVFALFRYSSLSAIVAAAAAPVYAWFLLSFSYFDFVAMVLVISAVLIWRHKSNIQKLLAGTEQGFKKK
jgi:acyl phosphate:glycerol-3-phosphate acyltransferase